MDADSSKGMIDDPLGTQFQLFMNIEDLLISVFPYTYRSSYIPLNPI